MQISIQRGKVVPFFELPPFSIALDGFVQGPEVDSDNCRFSFDHHNNCLRHCTTSACMQTRNAIELGLSDLEKYTIYANDVDLDVALSIWCLQNSDQCTNPLVKKLVDAVGIQDMTGGAIPANGMSKTIEWIAAPETDSKRFDDYGKISESGLHSILEATLHRIDLYVSGESSVEVSKVCIHGEYKILRSENDWVVVESSDPHVYPFLYKAGFTKLVIVRPQGDGSLRVSLAKKSDFISGFPLFKMYDALNQLEPGWGGSSSIGGSPRNADGTGTKLPLEKIIEVIDGCL